MDNAFFSGAQNARAFLMQPQMERERMQDRQRRMAEEDLQMERARQAQMAAQQAAQMEAQRAQSEADIYARRMGVPARVQSMGAAQGLGGQPAAPMGAPMQPPTMQQAPAQPAEPPPEAFQDGGTVTVSGIRARRPEPLENPSQSDLIDDLMVAAYQRNDTSRFLELAQQRQSLMSQEELTGRRLIGAAAVQILTLPPAQRPAAVRMALQQFGVDPASTGIDDITDPAQLESALRFEAFRGDPEAWIKQQVETQGTRDEFRRPEIIDQGNQRTVVSMSGPTAGQPIQSFGVRADPNTIARERGATQREAMGNATQREIAQARIAADRAEAAARNAQGAEKLRLEAAALDLRRQEQAMTRQWLQGNSGGSMPGSAGITWGQ